MRFQDLQRIILDRRDDRFKTPDQMERSVVYIRYLPFWEDGAKVDELDITSCYQIVTPNSLSEGEARVFLFSSIGNQRRVEPIGPKFRSFSDKERMVLRDALRKISRAMWPILHARTITRVIPLVEFLAQAAEAFGASMGWIHWNGSDPPANSNHVPPLCLTTMGGDRDFERAVRWGIRNGAILVVYSPISPGDRQWTPFYREVVNRLGDAGAVFVSKVSG